MDWLTVKLQSLKKKFSEYSRWSIIRKAQNESLLKATYVWFVFVPIMARFLSELEDKVTLPIGCKGDACIYTFRFDLFFSWKLLYIASLAFIISNILYRIFAHAIIKENADFGEFERAGKTETHLEEYMTEEFISGYEKEYGDEFRHQYGPSANYNIVSFGVDAYADLTGSASSKEPKENVFWAVFSKRDTENMRAIRVTLFCLAVSAGFSLIVTSQQIWHVFGFIWQHGLL